MPSSSGTIDRYVSRVLKLAGDSNIVVGPLLWRPSHGGKS
jgi:hypothetical protein